MNNMSTVVIFRRVASEHVFGIDNTNTPGVAENSDLAVTVCSPDEEYPLALLTPLRKLVEQYGRHAFLSLIYDRKNIDCY